MRTCTITQAKANTVFIRKCIGQAEQIRDERRVVRDRLRATWKDHDRGSDDWEQRHDRIEALYDELSTAFNKTLSRANSLIADMATMVIVADPESEVILDELQSACETLRDVAEFNAEILSTSESATVDILEAEKNRVTA